MKSRNRPPLNFTLPEPPTDPVGFDIPAETDGSAEVLELVDAVEDIPLAETAPAAEPATEATPQGDTPAEPPAPRRQPLMSERRKRKLAEAAQKAAEEAAAAAARAEAEMAAAEPPAAELTIDLVEPEHNLPAAAVEEAPVPAPPVTSAPGTQVRPQKTPSTSYGLIAGGAAALWIAGVAAWAAYEIGSGAAQPEVIRLAVYVLVALAPAGLAMLLAQALSQGARLSQETRRARDLADALLAPTSLAAQQTGQVLQSLRADIDLATLAAERARNDLVMLKEALSEETSRLNAAADVASRTARQLVEQLSSERSQLADLGTTLDAQATGVMETVERQSRMVVDATDLAQTQLREAETALAARAADLAAAAGEAQEAARAAADDLSRQTLRLENAGSGVAEQIQSVEEGLGQQRAALVTAAFSLRSDQEDFSAQVESQRAQLTEQLSAARTIAHELGETTLGASQSLQDLVEAATDQFRALTDMTQKEADAFDAGAKEALDRFEALAAEARVSLAEQTRLVTDELHILAQESRQAAEEAATQAQVRVDRLGEALFDAARKADDAADARIAGARRVISESANLVDEAGTRALAAMEATVARMADAFDRIDDAMRELDARSIHLPEEAKARVELVRQTVEQGLQSLTAASQKAAADTEALELGFQERVRRNYDMLSEAVRLMGAVSGEPATARRREEIPAPARPAPVDDLPPLRPAGGSSLRGREPADRSTSARNRLRLEPTNSAPPADSGSMDWSDLVGSDRSPEPLDLDTPAMPPHQAIELTERVTQSIRRLGVDPNALLPRARVDEAADALALHAPDKARQIVRRVAPAAVRSVSRRVLSDPAMRADADLYVRAMALELRDLANSRDAAAVQTRLATDGGRAFLLLDAAIGDLT